MDINVQKRFSDKDILFNGSIIHYASPLLLVLVGYSIFWGMSQVVLYITIMLPHISNYITYMGKILLCNTTNR